MAMRTSKRKSRTAVLPLQQPTLSYQTDLIILERVGLLIQNQSFQFRPFRHLGCLKLFVPTFPSELCLDCSTRPITSLSLLSEIVVAPMRARLPPHPPTARANWYNQTCQIPGDSNTRITFRFALGLGVTLGFISVSYP